MSVKIAGVSVEDLVIEVQVAGPQGPAGIAVADTSSIDLTLTGHQLSADAKFGTGSGTVCQGNDARLSDARTPTSHDHSSNKLAQANTHQSADTDAGVNSLHHTLGTGANQASAGNHFFHPPQAVSGITYDAAGNMTAYTEGGISYTMTYDANGNMLTSAGGGYTATYSYDAYDNLTGVAIS